MSRGEVFRFCIWRELKNKAIIKKDRGSAVLFLLQKIILFLKHELNNPQIFELRLQGGELLLQAVKFAVVIDTGFMDAGQGVGAVGGCFQVTIVGFKGVEIHFTPLRPG